ncbi:MAG TPA: DinB family protein, partial [Methylomirabilota bacterium]|nr:DinB family protein [Methylomirabilota bacterium]
MDSRQLLTTTMARSYARLRARVEGLTDEEFFWQPIPDSWTIYEDKPGHWTYHYAIPEPDPAPLTTIGWQLVHLGTTKLMYHEWAYGDARLTFPQIQIPSG